MAKNRQAQYSGIGGQAVLEGVMMKNKTKYAVAVRKPDGDIDVQVEEVCKASADQGRFCLCGFPRSWNAGDDAFSVLL